MVSFEVDFDSLQEEEGFVAQRCWDGAQSGDGAEIATPANPSQAAIGDRFAQNATSRASAFALRVERSMAEAQSRAQAEAQQHREASTEGQAGILEAQRAVPEAAAAAGESKTGVDQAVASRAATQVAARWWGDRRETPW